MNYLAHIFLSGPDVEIRFGNFIGDDIKGKNYLDYSPKIQKGILLHRYIDSYTDQHNQTLEILRILRPNLGKLAGVALDVYNDHFLAVKWDEYSTIELDKFCKEFYSQMDDYHHKMPPRTKRLFYYMSRDNWLSNYRSKSGLSVTFENMARKYSFAEQLRKGPQDLVLHYTVLSNYFDSFFPILRKAVREFMKN